MIVKFTHYLVTRFNVPVEGWNRDKSGQTVLDESWMNHRLALFLSYCLPTIVGQTEKKFQWILYCDKNTPVAYRLQIETAVSMIQGVKIRDVSHLAELMEDLRSLI
ncbi:MAG: glycosyltransferase [Saprospiraceae bacterium]